MGGKEFRQSQENSLENFSSAVNLLRNVEPRKIRRARDFSSGN